MLIRLHIENFALIENADIELGTGLNIITGETGAGKSILIGALQSILGAPVAAETIRSGADHCVVEGLFEFDEESPAAGRLKLLDADLEDGQLILRREIRSGRSRAFINGALVPQRRLREIGAVLADLHGQHEHQSLLQPDLHGRFVDESGGLTSQVELVAAAFNEYDDSERQTQRLVTERHALLQQEELRGFQLQEILQLAPEVGEEESLEREVAVLSNLAALTEGATELCDSLYEGTSSLFDQLGNARRKLLDLAATDPQLQPGADGLEQALFRVEDVAAQLRDYASGLSADPQRLEHARERLDTLQRLLRKYGPTVDDVLALAQQLENAESRANDLEADLEQAQTRRDQSLQVFTQQCRALSASRRSAAEALTGAVEEALSELGMENCTFVVDIDRVPDDEGLIEDGDARYRAGPGGMDDVQFLISANIGEAPRPLARIASGGEISRIMLALKQIIAERDQVSILVFDEIDAGISGKVAAAVARRLEVLARSHQVIAITHLPQIASRADRHFSVRKRQVENRTITEILPLEDEGERSDEIAHLLGGETVSPAARRHAQEMLR
jgi:DNA repair protein RecN (Recombination protein N)